MWNHSRYWLPTSCACQNLAGSLRHRSIIVTTSTVCRPRRVSSSTEVVVSESRRRRGGSMGGGHAGVVVDTDYGVWTNSELIARVTELERQLQLGRQSAEEEEEEEEEQQQQRQLMQRVRPASPRRASTTIRRRRQKVRRANLFDPSKYSTRHIALKIAYLGQGYNGFEHANGNITALPTIEEMLWKALRKGRLISPVSDEPTEIAWSYAERSAEPLVMNWEGCQYSKCGRTDKGVSAFGQVIGIRVRSNRPLERSSEQINDEARTVDSAVNGDDEASGAHSAAYLGRPLSDVNRSFHSIKDELPYISILNSILPSDIRVLAWCPHPPPDFDARFSCGERRYKYFFTNPAFLPTPGYVALRDDGESKNGLREGWLNVESMRCAARKLLGLHDFRNFCRIDASRQLTKFERLITHVDVERVEQQSGPTAFARNPHLSKTSPLAASTEAPSPQCVAGPEVYCFTVHGSAFLWHQVRHMVAILFLVGQGLEPESLIDDLLDIEKNDCRPTYGMASDAPLVLWDCTFPKDKSQSCDDALDWVCAGDAPSLDSINTKGDGKYGSGGVVDGIWSNWRKHKIDEVLSSSLLDLVVSQGDGSALERGGLRDVSNAVSGSQKLFDGSETARLAGRYIPVMELPTVQTVDVQNSKYREGKGNRREIRLAQDVNSTHA